MRCRCPGTGSASRDNSARPLGQAPRRAALGAAHAPVRHERQTVERVQAARAAVSRERAVDGLLRDALWAQVPKLRQEHQRGPGRDKPDNLGPDQDRTEDTGSHDGKNDDRRGAQPARPPLGLRRELNGSSPVVPRGEMPGRRVHAWAYFAGAGPCSVLGASFSKLSYFLNSSTSLSAGAAESHAALYKDPSIDAPAPSRSQMNCLPLSLRSSPDFSRSY